MKLSHLIRLYFNISNNKIKLLITTAYKQLVNLINLYDDVSFYRVVEHKKTNMPNKLLWLDNFKQITYTEYVNLCSIGGIAH